MAGISRQQAGQHSAAGVHTSKPRWLRRLQQAAALLLAAMMLLMVLAAAGHGIDHQGQGHDSHACPVCQFIGGYEKLLAALLLLSLVLVNKPVRRQAGLLRLVHLPLLPRLTPVFLKVKLSN